MIGPDIAMNDMRPAGWGEDALSAYLELAHQNRLATFANKPERMHLLIAIDQCFTAVTTDWVDPGSFIPALLFIRAHATFRACCEAAMSGAAVGSFVMARAILEASGYSLLIHRTTGLDRAWLQRHDENEGVAKRAKGHFKVSRVRAAIEAEDPDLASRFHALYNEAIDFGAHPNERSVSGNMIREAGADRMIYSSVILHGDGVPMEHSQIAAAQAGHCALEILQFVFPARFADLGVRERILELREIL